MLMITLPETGKFARNSIGLGGIVCGGFVDIHHLGLPLLIYDEIKTCQGIAIIAIALGYHQATFCRQGRNRPMYIIGFDKLAAIAALSVKAVKH